MSLDGLSINLATVREQWGFAEAVDGCLRHGITTICPWREQVAGDRPRRGGAHRPRQRR